MCDAGKRVWVNDCGASTQERDQKGAPLEVLSAFAQREAKIRLAILSG